MAVENWIDAYTEMIGGITVKKQAVKSFSLFKKDNFPKAISEFPSALTFIDGVNLQASGTGPSIEFWTGTTEFHIFPDIGVNNYPGIMPWFRAIRDQFGTHVTLSGKVTYCLLVDNPYCIEGPVTLTYGTDAPHLGLVAHWRIKNHVNAEFTFGG